jgi:hypothetical protein
VSAQWRPRVPAWAWRLIALSPPGRIHERRYRRVQGMPAAHPEHVTRPATAGERALLGVLQAQMWPEGEYRDLLRLWLENGAWGEKR